MTTQDSFFHLAKAASRYDVRRQQTTRIQARLSEAQFRIAHGAIYDLPTAVVLQVDAALADLCTGLAHAQVEARAPLANWPGVAVPHSETVR